MFSMFSRYHDQSKASNNDKMTIESILYESDKNALSLELNEPHQNTLFFDKGVFDIVVTPIIVNGTKKGSVIEWIDRSMEIEIENEIDGIIEKAAEGEFSQQINTKGKEGFHLALSNGLNNLTQNCRKIMLDMSNALQSLSSGDLNHHIATKYHGELDKLVNA